MRHWAARLKRLRSSLAMRAFCRESIMLYKAPPSPSRIPQSRLEVKHASSSRLPDLAWFHELQELEVFRRFLAQGHVGYLAYLDGQCVHRSWYIPGPASIREHWSQVRQIGPGEGFVHYCKTAEAARGQGVFPLVLATIAKEQGESRVTMAIATENAASRHAAGKAGWTPVAETAYAVTLGVRRQRRRTLPAGG